MDYWMRTQANKLRGRATGTDACCHLSQPTRCTSELISTIRDAPQVLQDLNQYIAALSQILNALKTNLDGRSARVSESQIACLQAAKQTLEGCDLACKDFKTKMEELTVHSQDGRRSFRDSCQGTLLVDGPTKHGPSSSCT
jgi:hypothetical protein